MVKRKKPIPDMTDEEIEKYIFPKKVLDELQWIAHEKDDPEEEDTDSSRE